LGSTTKTKKIKYKDLTKKCFEILNENGTDAIVRLLYEPDYDELPESNSKLRVLEMAYICAQHAGYQTANENEKKKIDEGFKEMKEFFEVFDVDYSS